MTVSASAAEKVKAKVQIVKDNAQAIVDAIAVEKEYAMGKLEAAKPALEEAEAALQASLYRISTVSLNRLLTYFKTIPRFVLSNINYIDV